MNTPEFREKTASQLDQAGRSVAGLTAFIGLDGFVDEILHVVDKRESAEVFTRVPTISSFAQRMAGAAGRSTNVELVNVLTKLGGNGPIMANALATFGLQVTYLGNLGYPSVHPVFAEFAQRARVHSIAAPGHTDALEFDDGKIMVGKHSSLKEVNWANIEARFGRENFASHFASSSLVGFVNWTMLPYMSDIWEAVQREICPRLEKTRRKIFFDLADPEKRKPEDIRRALELIHRFGEHFDVILGLNEKEAHEVAKVYGLTSRDQSPEGLGKLALQINDHVRVDTLVVHPVTYALAVSNGCVDMVEGPCIPRPVITTGAGDHFNSGFCLGKLLGFSNAMSLLTGVATSGYYVRSAKSPGLTQLTELMRHWPEKNA